MRLGIRGGRRRQRHSDWWRVGHWAFRAAAEAEQAGAGVRYLAASVATSASNDQKGRCAAVRLGLGRGAGSTTLRRILLLIRGLHAQAEP